MRLRKKKTLLDQASDYVETLRPQVEAAVSQAFDAVEGFVDSTARPALHDAREKAADYAGEARKKAAPVVATGAALAAERAAAAKELADAKVAQLKGEPQKKKGGKLRKLALFALIAGAAGFAAKKLQGQSGTDNWQSSYVPTPPPEPTPAPSPTGEEDPGGASPDEAIADQAEGAHAATTPDEPAEVISIDENKQP